MNSSDRIYYKQGELGYLTTTYKYYPTIPHLFNEDLIGKISAETVAIYNSYLFYIAYNIIIAANYTYYNILWSIRTIHISSYR